MNKVEGVVPCSNHGCVFGHPGGMGTNGQCHCLDIRPPDARIRATRNVLALRDALTAERERADRAEAEQETLSGMRDEVLQYQREFHRLRAESDELRERVARLVEALEKLARLGNEPHYGNSHGNVIAQDALRTALGEKVERLHAALAEADEPVAFMYEYDGCADDAIIVSPSKRWQHCQEPSTETPLYTRPPRREPLTEEKMAAVRREACAAALFMTTVECKRIVRIIERAHGIGEPQ